MIISHKHKFIFIKTHKTAGSSIQLALEKHCGPDDIVCKMGPHTIEELETFTPRNEGKFLGHDLAHIIRSRIGMDVWNEYLTIAFTRNPFDRVVSQFWWDFHGRTRTTQTFKQYLRAYASNRLSKWHLSNWYFYTDPDDKIIVDFMGKYESLLYDYQRLCELLEIPFEMLPQLKSNTRKDKHRSYRDYYGEKEIDLIKQNVGCRKEMEAFNYAF